LGDGCWRWTGAINSCGYGNIWDGERNQQAHRVSYEMAIGPIPKGLTIDHLCRNRACVNPAHLEPVTCRTNILRSPVALAARWIGRTHCAKGHELSGDNVIQRSDGGRRCRACRNERSKVYCARWYVKHRAQ